MEQHFIEDSLIILTKPTIDRFLKEKNCAELMALYTFYYYTAKWQRTNQPRCTTSYVAKALHWKEDKVRRVKKQLADMGLVEDVQDRDKNTNKIIGHYVSVKFIFKQETEENIKKATLPQKGECGIEGRQMLKENSNKNALSNGNFSTSPCDAPIPAESVRNEKAKSLWDISREITGNDPFTFPCQPTSDSEEISAAGIVKKKPLVKNLTDMDDKDIKLLRAALLGKAYGMAIIDDVPFSMQCGTDHGVATLTMKGAFDYWLDNALYRESAREAYLSKFLEAWKNIRDNCADRFWMPVRGGDGYVWQNVIKGYANNWNPGTPSERREAKAKEIFE